MDPWTRKIQLTSGLDAPEGAEVCRDANGRDYRCGQTAANALSDYLGARQVASIPRELDRYGRTVAACAVGSEDIGDWLVRRGLATDFAHYSKGKYRAARGLAGRPRQGSARASGPVNLVEVRMRLPRACIRQGNSPSLCSFQ